MNFIMNFINIMANFILNVKDSQVKEFLEKQGVCKEELKKK